MPLVIIIGIIWIIYKSAKKPRKRKAPPPLPVYDPVKIQIAQAKEADRQRREQDRQADRQRRIAAQEQKRKEQEQKQLDKLKKEQEEKQAAQDKIEWLSCMIDKYSDLSEQIENELANNPSLTAYKTIQLQKQLLSMEEKIRKLHEQRDKAYFIANS